jgi:hypothetical protein
VQEVAPERLTKWVTRMCADLTDEGPPHRFELYHTVDGSVERLAIHRLKEGDSAEDIAQALFDEAKHDLETRESRAQRYTIALFRSEEQQQPEVQYPFRIQPAAGSAWSGGDTEQPTEAGKRAMEMRVMNEAYGLMGRMAESMGGRMSLELDRERAARYKAEEEARRMRQENEDLADRRLDRELARASELMQQKLIGDMMTSLVPLVPHVAGALLSRFMNDGKKNGKEHETPRKMFAPVKDADMSSRETLLRELFANLSDEEKQGLVGSLSALNKMAIVTLASKAQEAKDDIQRAAFDAGMQKFMKGLSSEEVMGVMASFDQGNRNRFMLIYQSYGKAEEKAQEGTPDLLKDVPPAPAENSD